MEFQTMYCRGVVRPGHAGFHDIVVQGQIIDDVRDAKVRYIAAAGADRRASYSGSGLPFASQIQAFENTPNVGIAQLDVHNRFEIPLVTPNSYMVGLGSVQVPPTLYLSYERPNGEKRTVSVRVAEPIPYRSMTYPTTPRARIDATFYDSQFELVAKTQEKIFYDSTYPCDRKTHANFWGKRPVN